MSLLKENEVEFIIKTYKEIKSIDKTAKLTGYCKNTVNKYVRNISRYKKRSRNCKNEILQIDLNTGNIIKVWYKPSVACKELKINPSEVCRVLKGELRQAGGFGWRYKDITINNSGVLGENIFLYKKMHKYTRKEFSYLINISESYLYAIEKQNFIPSDEIIDNICTALNINRLDLTRR